jgi:cell division protein FtsB
MPTELNPPPGLELESTAELPTLPGNAPLSIPDRLSATDAWRIVPPLGDGLIGPTDQTVPEYDRRSLEQQLHALEQQLKLSDGRIAALEAELERRGDQIKELEAELEVLREELLQSKAELEQLQARDAGRPAPAAQHRAEEAPSRRLLVRTEGSNGIVHVLTRRTTVGRTPDNDLRVEADFVSRHHAVLLQAGADTVLEDLHSTNGTYVNGEQIVRRTLREGDVLGFGKILYRFVIKPA